MSFLVRIYIVIIMAVVINISMVTERSNKLLMNGAIINAVIAPKME